MSRFIINKNVQPSGEYEVHNLTSGCGAMPLPQNQIDLGWHSSCHGALAQARMSWPQAVIDGCAFCCPSCHTR
ncbi:MAG: hypothetical protein LCH84_02380 [Gemmatimonadetes bacterium]|nr:hypothetical protein [Gemmatimonadota bacterium]